MTSMMFLTTMSEDMSVSNVYRYTARGTHSTLGLKPASGGTFIYHSDIVVLLSIISERHHMILMPSGIVRVILYDFRSSDRFSEFSECNHSFLSEE